MHRLRLPRSWVMALLLVGLAGLLASCATTKRRIVTKAADAPDNKVKFIYQEYPDEKTGVIECKADSKGNLSDCRKLKIKFVDKFIQY